MAIFPQAPSVPHGVPDVERAIRQIQFSQTLCLPVVETLPTAPVDSQILIQNHSVQWYDNGTWNSLGGGASIGGGDDFSILTADNSGIYTVFNHFAPDPPFTDLYLVAATGQIYLQGLNGVQLSGIDGNVTLQSDNSQVVLVANNNKINLISGVSVSLVLDGNNMLKADPTGLGFFGATPVAQQTGGADTAAGTYGATEQGMIQRMYDALRNYGLLT